MKYKQVVMALVFIGFIFSFTAKADHDADVHLAAHLGVSYALDTFLYGFNKHAFRMDRTDAETFAAFTTLFIGLVYKVQENAAGQDMLRATWQNGLGIGAAVLTRAMFHWEF